MHFSAELWAAQETTCNPTPEGTYHCTTTYYYDGGVSSLVDFSHWYINEYNASVNVISGNPYPDYLTVPQIEKELEAEYDKTPWDGEKIGDYIQALYQTKELITYLMNTYNLSPEMIAKLEAAYGQATRLITYLNSGVQITNHLINYEWGYAGSEIATVLAGAVLSGVVTLAGGSVIVTTSAMLFAGIVILPRLEDYLDSQLEDYNHVDLLENINIKFNLPNIYQIAEDAVQDLYCASLPPHKRELVPYCSVPPIVIDLDGNGVAFKRFDASNVLFDVDNNGVVDNVSWPTKGNAVLFADWNGSGIVDKRTEFMFSLFSVKKLASDLEGLKMFDYEDDGDIDSNDVIYEKLYLWDDLNEDGICSIDEVTSLADLNLTLNFKGIKDDKKVKYKEVDGNKIQHKFRFKADFTKEGHKVKSGAAYSVLLRSKIAMRV